MALAIADGHTVSDWAWPLWGYPRFRVGYIQEGGRQLFGRIAGEIGWGRGVVLRLAPAAASPCFGGVTHHHRYLASLGEPTRHCGFPFESTALARQPRGINAKYPIGGPVPYCRQGQKYMTSYLG